MHSRSFPASVKPRHKPGDSDRRGRARTVASSSQPARPSSHSHTGRPGPGACDCERRSPFSTTGVTTHPPTWPPPTEGRPPGTPERTPRGEWRRSTRRPARGRWRVPCRLPFLPSPRAHHAVGLPGISSFPHPRRGRFSRAH